MLLPTAFFPPTEYFAMIARYSVLIDACGNYQKQSYRNRCRILAAGGVEDLRVPIVHDGKKRIDEVLVDYSTDWVRRLEYAIDSAYMSSPFFEYYRDGLFAILDSHPQTLFELNMKLIEFFCSKIGIPAPGVSRDHEGEFPDESIHPKKPRVMEIGPYWQVFREKYGFTPGLSVMDLLFNEGPESICYLK